jgi:hypothetical protein
MRPTAGKRPARAQRGRGWAVEAVGAERGSVFDHPDFRVFDFESIPLNQDLYLVDEAEAPAYERSMVDLFEGRSDPPVESVGYIGARSVSVDSVALSWFPNIFSRFHEVSISLPRDQFVACVGCDRYDETPHVFVKSEWIRGLYARTFSVFCMVDAIGVSNALNRGALSREKLIALRSGTDELAARYPDLTIVSFADSTLVKSNWSPGYHAPGRGEFAYDPETFLRVAEEFNALYLHAIQLPTYAVLTQGSNEYYKETSLHISESGNHVCLNNLGLPFAQLMAIDGAAREAIRKGIHKPAELYMDSHFYRSLRFKADFERDSLPSSSYSGHLMASAGRYYCASRATALAGIEAAPD